MVLNNSLFLRLKCVTLEKRENGNWWSVPCKPELERFMVMMTLVVVLQDMPNQLQYGLLLLMVGSKIHEERVDLFDSLRLDFHLRSSSASLEEVEAKARSKDENK